MKISSKQYAQGLYELTKDIEGSELDLVLKKFVELLAKNHNLKKAHEIITEYKKIEKKERGVVELEITSARKLDSETISKVKNVFASEVEAVETIDESIIGGVKVKIEDKILDASVKTQLKTMQHALLS